MKNLEDILSEHPFLKGMDKKHIQLLSGCSKNVVFKAGSYIFKEGEDADSFYFIKNGKIVIESYVPHKGAILIRTREAGEILGWSWLVPPYKWHFDARATEVTKAISLDGKCLRGKCEGDHDLGYEIMKRFNLVIAERLEATRLQLMDIYGKNSDHK